MKTLKNFFVVCVCVLGLSSCGTLGGSLGSGTIGGALTDIFIGNLGTNNTPIGDAMDNVSGRWYDRTRNATITTTAQTATKGIYQVANRDGRYLLYLAPFSEQMKAIPYGVSVIQYKPAFDGKRLYWKVNTTRGVYTISPTSGQWYGSTDKY